MRPEAPVGADAIAAKGWLRAHKWLLIRRACQAAVLGLFLLGPLAGIWIIKGNLASSLLLETVPFTDPVMLLQIIASKLAMPASDALIGAAIVVAIYVAVGGRVYCAFVCPVNVVTDAADWLRNRLGIRTSARLTRNARYWLLAMVLVLSTATGTLAYELVNPVSMVYRGLVFGMGFAWLVVLAVFLLDLLVAKRGWCGHLCPMGAFYSGLGAVSPVRIRADRRDDCNDCMDCYVVCPEPQVIPPALKGAEQGSGPVVLSGNCTNCGRCIDVCSKDVFRFGLRYPNRVDPRFSGGRHGRDGHEVSTAGADTRAPRLVSNNVSTQAHDDGGCHEKSRHDRARGTARVVRPGVGCYGR